MRFLPLRLALVGAIACSGTKSDDSPAPSEGPPTRADAGPDPSSNDNQPQDTVDPRVDVSRQTQSFGGRTRSYLLGKPKAYDASKSYPLVLAFHGNPSSAQAQATFYPFQNVSKANAIVVYPQASTTDWDLYTPTDDNADMKWIAQLPKQIKTQVNVDLKKVFGFGFSGGGFFVSQFACRFGGVFKAISVNAGGGPDEEQMGYDTRDDGCYVCPGGPIATLVTHGESDGTVTYDSGEFTKNCYAGTNGCSGDEVASSPSPCTTFKGCPASKPVKWCLIPGLGHNLWQNAMTEAWAFFTALP